MEFQLILLLYLKKNNYGGEVMNEKLNLVEILKDCPKGTKLYLTTLGEVEFCQIDSGILPIRIKHKEAGEVWLTQEGKAYKTFGGECILFPSKEQRDWSKFKPTCEFKDGDILSYKCASLMNRTIYIYRYRERVNTAYYVAISGANDAELMIDDKGVWALNGYNDTARFATEEEKQKLFQAIKDNGYKWNAETKTLEKLVEPKFDPKTLKPYMRVLVRDSNKSQWRCTFYSHEMENEKSPFKYAVTGSSLAYIYCIPYNEDTKHLVGTDDEAPEYYRYWRD